MQSEITDVRWVPLLTVRRAAARLQAAPRHLTLLLLAALMSNASAAGFSLSAIVNLLCSFIKELNSTALLGAAGVGIALVFGWNKLLGEGNAFQGLKNGVIGAVCILSAGTIATALFGSSGCGVG